MEKLIIVVRADLQPGAQLAQSCHAVATFAVDHPEAFTEWARDVKNIVCLSVADEPALEALLVLAVAHTIPVSGFVEPDFNNALTAIALGAGGHRITSALPLALREKRVARHSRVCEATGS